MVGSRSDIRVRRAVAGDEALWVDAVATLVPERDRDDRLVSAEEARSALEDRRCYLFLALDGRDPVGLTSAYRFPDVEAGGSRVYLYDIEVAEEHRRRGIGAALVEALVAQCEADGVSAIWAGTERDNHAARRTFESTEGELEGDRYVEYEWDLEP